MHSLCGGKIIFSSYPPKLILICGPCRVGTTALSNVFAKAGIESHMQPIKSARRAKADGEESIPWRIGTKREEFAAVKETFGPKTEAEFFNPLEILLSNGYPKERLIVIPIVRNPNQALASWKRMWGKVELGRFAYTYELTFKIMEEAEKNGILTIPYVHEIIKDQEPSAIVKKLFKLVGLPSNHLTNNSWGEFKGSENVFFYDDPPERFVSGIKERGKYEYKDLAFSEEDRKLVESAPQLEVIYGIFRKLCESRLAL